jgi:phospholipase/carboxylesterase
MERYGAPLAGARAVVVLIHGRGHSPEYMDEHVVRRLQRPDVAFVAPRAADGTWYPNSFLAPLDDNQPGLDFTMQRMAALRDQLLGEGTPAERIVWCGFSQGACVASQFVSTDPRRWGGLIAFTGGLIGPPGTQWTIDGDYGGMPAYFSTSDVDAFVPEDRVRETAARFADAGAQVAFELHLRRAHEIADAEINRALFILSALPTHTTL